MINRIVVGAGYGLRDWLAQRATAVIMALYTVIIVAAILIVGPSDYEAWRGLFACGFIKFATFVCFVSLVWHAWIGIRDIWMDYISMSVLLRLALHVATAAALVGYVGWMASILWRV